MMGTREHGVMGKCIFFWGLIAATALASSAQARPHRHARTLPSQVKTIRLQPSRHALPKAPRSVPMPDADFSADLRAEARENPWASKFYSRTVYYVRSSARVPESYDCDSAIEERKKAEAENEALAKCEAAGLAECRLAKVLISKNGILQCRDFPGKRCPSNGHFRGCVAEALVLGTSGSVSQGF